MGVATKPRHGVSPLLSLTAHYSIQNCTMDAAIAEFLRYLALEKNASAHTVKSYREDLTQAVEFFRSNSSE